MQRCQRITFTYIYVQVDWIEMLTNRLCDLFSIIYYADILPECILFFYVYRDVKYTTPQLRTFDKHIMFIFCITNNWYFSQIFDKSCMVVAQMQSKGHE